jgi:hypothetical protein
MTSQSGLRRNFDHAPTSDPGCLPDSGDCQTGKASVAAGICCSAYPIS